MKHSIWRSLFSNAESRAKSKALPWRDWANHPTDQRRHRGSAIARLISLSLLCLISAALFSTATFASGAAEAAIIGDVELLIETKDCPVCILTDSDLSHKDLAGANLKVADLSRANLSDTDLSGADFTVANLFQANLDRANLSGANFSGVDLSSATLRDADLSGANLTNAVFVGSDLAGANLENVYWTGADFKDTDLSKVNLTGVQFRGVDLTGVVLCQTTMPSGDISNRDCD
ncbi:MAG: pentapeptide repeat-containing protein [Elainellaceae cyanobacterium]